MSLKSGKQRAPVYISWAKMKLRCNNPNHHCYHRYGGRGITYDPRWEVFENFFADMGHRPEGSTLDRINNNGPYNKENCKWSTQAEQNLNKNLETRSTFGIAGVQLHPTGLFQAMAYKEGRQWYLHLGPDFFEACCARKSWEARGKPIQAI